MGIREDERSVSPLYSFVSKIDHNCSRRHDRYSDLVVTSSRINVEHENPIVSTYRIDSFHARIPASLWLKRSRGKASLFSSKLMARPK
jgi:hypothetical protein